MRNGKHKLLWNQQLYQTRLNRDLAPHVIKVDNDTEWLAAFSTATRVPRTFGLLMKTRGSRDKSWAAVELVLRLCVHPRHVQIARIFPPGCSVPFLKYCRQMTIDFVFTQLSFWKENRFGANATYNYFCGVSNYASQMVVLDWFRNGDLRMPPLPLRGFSHLLPLQMQGRWHFHSC